MICIFGAILALSSDDDKDDTNADAEYNGHKSDPYMSPSYTGDTKSTFWTF